MLNKFRHAFPRLIASSALMGSSVALSLANAKPDEIPVVIAISGIINLISSLAGNVASNDVYNVLADKISHEDILANGHLTNAIADAVRATIAFSAEQPANAYQKDEILKLAEGTSALLQKLLNGEINDIKNLRSAQNEIEKISKDNIAEIFAVDADKFAGQKSALSIDAWQEIVLWLAVEKEAKILLPTSEIIAQDLHNHFPQIFAKTIEYDNGKAYASLTSKIYNRILSGQKEIFAAINVVSTQIVNLEENLKKLLRELPASTAEEVKKILQENEVISEIRRKLEIHEFRQYLQTNVVKVLNQDTENAFFHKHVPSSIYFRREKIESMFGKFLNQSEKNCFVVIGEAGMGKTCLLCYFAESLTVAGSQCLPLLMNAGNFSLTNVNYDELKKTIINQIKAVIPFFEEDLSFEKLGSLIGENNLKLVILIDGINESPANVPPHIFNHQFNVLLNEIKQNNLPICFALTCRYESWQHFNSGRWIKNHIFDINPEEKATVRIVPFNEKEVKQLSEKYFSFYAIDGELSGEAIETCKIPLSLRFLCDACTNRGTDDKSLQASAIETYHLGEVSSLERKDILKQFVASRRNEFVEFTDNALRKKGIYETTPSDIYRLTTFYIIHIANFMYEKKAASITLEEVFNIAQSLNHPDQDLGIERIALSSDSVFMRLIDLGIFSRSNTNAFSFVYETYFEFSLGRYIAFVRWVKKTNGNLSAELIQKDLEALIKEHSGLSKAGKFSNLFGAIQFAILATETGDWMQKNAEIPIEETVYFNHPIFSDLLLCLANTKEGFDWLQQTCAIIRETELAKRKTWEQLDNRDKRRAARIQFDKILQVLDTLANTTDFVLLWDIENTIFALSQANFELTLEQLKNWAKSENNLKTIFATQVVSKLALLDSQKVIQVLLEWMKYERFRSNFWIIRSLLFAISEITQSAREDAFEENSDWRQLREEVYKLAEAAINNEVSPFVGSRALSILPSLSLGQTTQLNAIDTLVDSLLLKKENSWQLLNLFFELAKTDIENHEFSKERLFNLLARAAETQNHHLLYAIEKVLDSIDDKNSANEKVIEINRKIRKSRWRTILIPGAVTPIRNEKVGVVYTPKYLEPDYENHPECRERLLTILNKLESCGAENFVWIIPREARPQELKNAHDERFDRHRNGAAWSDYVETVQRVSELRTKSKNQFERKGASELRFESFEIATIAAGGVIQAIDYVQKNNVDFAFVLTRPPGHLANNTICIFNNIAIGAHHALDHYEMKRVLIIDFDAHHGKHTQQVFYEQSHQQRQYPDSQVIYFSIHIDGDYARENGMVNNIGTGKGRGYIFNVPYPANMGDDGYKYIIDNLLLPVALDFKPEIILLSAGFDGHFDDPLTPTCLISENSYIHLAEKLKIICETNNCKIVGALEGGYGLDGMANSLAQMLNVWGNWGLEKEIGFTPRSEANKNLVNPATLEDVKEIVAERIELMREVKEQNDEYFFSPSAAHW